MKTNKEEKIILTDVDGVLLDWEPIIYEFLEHDKGIVAKEERKKGNYFLKDILEIPAEDARKLIVEFTHSDFFKKMPAKQCALDAVKQLKNDGWKFIAITACDQDHHDQDIKKALQNRADNLSLHFDDAFSELHFSKIAGCKSPFLQQYHPTWWIEDSVNNANTGHEIGHRSIIMHSQHYDEGVNIHKLPVARTWYDIKKLIDET